LIHFILEFGCRGFAVRFARGYPERCYPDLVFRRSVPHDLATPCAYGGRRFGLYGPGSNGLYDAEKLSLKAEFRGGHGKDVHIIWRKRGKGMADGSSDVLADLIKHQFLSQSTAHLVSICNRI
jgi:hypothetical protein